MSQKNVALIVLDTARADMITEEVAPVLHKLSEEGLRFERTFSCAPWTLPSHASLFTGTYPSKHKSGANYRNLDQDITTMADIFSKNGYRTVGYSNNAWVSRSFGFDKGFDEFNHGWQYVQSTNDFAKAAMQHEGLTKLLEVFKTFRSGNPLVNLSNLFYAFLHKYQGVNDDGAKRTTGEIKHWLQDRDGNSPFFLFVNYLEPHLEYRPPKEIAEKFLPENTTYEQAMEVPQNAWKYITGQEPIGEDEFEILNSLYMAEINYLDRYIGKLVGYLKQEGEWDDTIFVVLGDHGENIGDHELMDHQYCLYDSLIHVPLIVNNGFDEVDEKKLIQLNDLLPSLIDELDLHVNGVEDQIQGHSVHTDESREYVFAEYRHPQPSIETIEKRVGDPHNLMEKYDRSLTAIRDKSTKLIRGSDGSKEAYDMIKDPNESNDIYESGKFDKLESVLDMKIKEISDNEQKENPDMNENTKERLEDLGYLQSSN